MEIFGIGPLELALILVLALVLIGPRDIVAYSRKLAQFIRRVTQSDTWKDVVNTSQEIRKIPTELLRESGLDKELNRVKGEINPSDYQRWLDSQTRIPTPKGLPPLPSDDPHTNSALPKEPNDGPVEKPSDSEPTN